MVTQLIEERDAFRENTHDLNQIKNTIKMEKNTMLTASRDKISRLELKIKKFVEAAEKIEDQL